MDSSSTTYGFLLFYKDVCLKVYISSQSNKVDISAIANRDVIFISCLTSCRCRLPVPTLFVRYWDREWWRSFPKKENGRDWREVVGESAGKAAARSGQNFSGVEDDLRGHPGKMTCHEPGNFDRGYDSRRTNSKIQNYYPEFRR